MPLTHQLGMFARVNGHPEIRIGGLVFSGWWPPAWALAQRSRSGDSLCVVLSAAHDPFRQKVEVGTAEHLALSALTRQTLPSTASQQTW